MVSMGLRSLRWSPVVSVVSGGLQCSSWTPSVSVDLRRSPVVSDGLRGSP